jgi:hypothetical protein
MVQSGAAYSAGGADQEITVVEVEDSPYGGGIWRFALGLQGRAMWPAFQPRCPPLQKVHERLSE